MFEQTINSSAKQSLAILGQKKILPDAYLAGGTALALQIGHRISYDLDFFTPKPFDRRIIINQLQKFNFQLEQESGGTILGKLAETKFSFFYYPYSLLYPTKDFLGVAIADLKDITAMKIDAISSRGTKRDFTDLYFLAKEFSISEMLQFYDKKYSVLQPNKIHILKSLNYFVDADKDANPSMVVKNYSWLEIKNYFNQEVPKIAREILKLEKY